MLMLMLVIMIDIPLPANAERPTLNAQRRTLISDLRFLTSHHGWPLTSDFCPLI